MASTLIAARSLGKKYRLGGGPFVTTLRDRITAGIRPRLQRTAPEEFWALRDVSFDLAVGEVVGVIGRNGAGKSTLLKILSEITEPTEGEAEISGRVASLLEVGVGFHPELTGRENVFLNGAILGMSRHEIRRKFDEIVAFAEIEPFIDTPVKRYSSGMYVRLAFAVAAHLEPDVLIVDEVLAVGDLAFQRKCLGKMEDITHQGRAVLVVTHNMSIVTQLCEKTIWLDKGRVAAIGETRRVVADYMAQGLTGAMSWSPERPASDVFQYHMVAIESGGAQAGEAVPADAEIAIVFDFTVSGIIPPGRLSVRINRDDGLTVLTSSNSDADPVSNLAWKAGRQRLHCLIPGSLLAPGRYFVTVSEPLPFGNKLHENILSFTITDQNSLVARDRREGVVAPRLEWRSEA
jgi:lipopolysaccharide transport system ATP-binding protein